VTSATPYIAGLPVAFTSAAAACPHPTYQYWVRMPNGSWQVLRPFNSDSTWTWNTAGLAPGTYLVDVWANEQGSSTAKQQTYATRYVVLKGCASATLSPASGSRPVGSSVTFTAKSTGCPNPTYEFWIRDPAGRWTVGRTWGTATWTWNTSGKARGAYRIVVWANQQGASQVKAQAYDYSPYSLT
jgi:hypothetical protein